MGDMFKVGFIEGWSMTDHPTSTGIRTDKRPQYADCSYEEDEVAVGRTWDTILPSAAG
jgi:hypothetical protein